MEEEKNIQTSTEDNTNKKMEKESKKTKKSKLRMILVILFLLIFATVSYVQLRGSYLEYLELGEQYVNVFKTNLIYKYSIMAINFVFLY